MLVVSGVQLRRRGSLSGAGLSKLSQRQCKRYTCRVRYLEQWNSGTPHVRSGARRGRAYNTGAAGSVARALRRRARRRRAPFRARRSGNSGFPRPRPGPVDPRSFRLSSEAWLLPHPRPLARLGQRAKVVVPSRARQPSSCVVRTTHHTRCRPRAPLLRLARPRRAAREPAPAAPDADAREAVCARRQHLPGAAHPPICHWLSHESWRHVEKRRAAVAGQAPGHQKVAREAEAAAVEETNH